MWKLCILKSWHGKFVFFTIGTLKIEKVEVGHLKVETIENLKIPSIPSTYRLPSCTRPPFWGTRWARWNDRLEWASNDGKRLEGCSLKKTRHNLEEMGFGSPELLLVHVYRQFKNRWFQNRCTYILIDVTLVDWIVTWLAFHDLQGWRNIEPVLVTSTTLLLLKLSRAAPQLFAVPCFRPKCSPNKKSVRQSKLITRSCSDQVATSIFQAH